MRGVVSEILGAQTTSSTGSPRPRLAELVAALSLGIDLGFGQPMEHVLRQCLIALRLADHVGLEEEHRSAVYYSALLVDVGCHTDREVDVLRLVARGLSSRQIAERLVISPKTARNHIEHIYAKIVASSRATASLFAMQQGLLPEQDYLAADA